jgi:branched-chain amino acid transport system permease protein
MWAYFFRSIGPESFTLVESIFYLAAVIVGGMGSILGGIIGATFMTLVPELLRFGVEAVSPYVDNAGTLLSPVRTVVFGALIILFLVFEPQGLAEIVQRIRRFFHLWPFRK